MEQGYWRHSFPKGCGPALGIKKETTRRFTHTGLGPKNCQDCYCRDQQEHHPRLESLPSLFALTGDI